MKLTSKNKGLFNQRIFPLEPDKPDPRDLLLNDYSTSSTSRLPKSVDYSKETLPVGDQGSTGSCVGWSTAYLRSWLHRNSTNEKLKFSARFLWMAAKEIDNTELNVPLENAGTYIRDAMKVMRKHGATPDKLWPFKNQLPPKRSQSKVVPEAINYRIGIYESLPSNKTRIFHLATKGPFVTGVPVYENWSHIGSDGVVPMPAGRFSGGHAVLVVGFDNEARQFKFQNSWSSSWGDKGYGYFSYEFMESLAWSCWGADRL